MNSPRSSEPVLLAINDKCTELAILFLFGEKDLFCADLTWLQLHRLGKGRSFSRGGDRLFSAGTVFPCRGIQACRQALRSQLRLVCVTRSVACPLRHARGSANLEINACRFDLPDLGSLSLWFVAGRNGEVSEWNPERLGDQASLLVIADNERNLRSDPSGLLPEQQA